MTGVTEQWHKAAFNLIPLRFELSLLFTLTATRSHVGQQQRHDTTKVEANCNDQVLLPSNLHPPQDSIKNRVFITGCDENRRFHYLHSPARVSLTFKRKRDLIKLAGTEDEITFTVC